MRFYWLLVGSLAVWRLVHLLHAEDGPADLVVRLRRAAGRGFWGRVLDCFHCLSVWVAAPAALLVSEGWRERALLWAALSAAAILLERIGCRQAGVSPYHEDEEVPLAMLRPEETSLVREPKR
jgi:hypothetical protein